VQASVTRRSVVSGGRGDFSEGLKVIIRQYDTEQQALTALADRQVDTLLTQVAHRDALAPGLDHKG
jgi:ABC-type amino acid transport substrate-binding protein